MNLKHTLYRKNNYGQPCIWEVFPNEDNTKVVVQHGILGKSIITERFPTHRKIQDEITSRVNGKRKTGYKYLSEVTDEITLPVEESTLIRFLTTYLEDDRTTSDGIRLPMLAKVYDNKDNRLFKKGQVYIGQPKINGLRCIITATDKSTDIFKPFRFVFQSREGTIWGSLSDLEDYLIANIPADLLEKMLNENYALDGELYLPGYTVNEINHFVKDSTAKENKLLQYWCYDLIIEDVAQETRSALRETYLLDCAIDSTKAGHENNKKRLVNVWEVIVDMHSVAHYYRDVCINQGFEGLILRNVEAEYQFGKRNLSMIKFKAVTDGKFEVIDIIPEGIKRSNIPLLKLRNDINDETFYASLNGSFEYQESVLKDKDKYIGKYVFIEYGERSGITEVPFHIKTVAFV